MGVCMCGTLSNSYEKRLKINEFLNVPTLGLKVVLKEVYRMILVTN